MIVLDDLRPLSSLPDLVWACFSAYLGLRNYSGSPKLLEKEMMRTPVYKAFEAKVVELKGSLLSVPWRLETEDVLSLRCLSQLL